MIKKCRVIALSAATFAGSTAMAWEETTAQPPCPLTPRTDGPDSTDMADAPGASAAEPSSQGLESIAAITRALLAVPDALEPGWSQRLAANDPAGPPYVISEQKVMPLVTCTATQISPAAVLTAAHCVFRETTAAEHEATIVEPRAEALWVARPLPQSGRLEVTPVAQAIPHERWHPHDGRTPVPRRSLHDVAYVRLGKSFSGEFAGVPLTEERLKAGKAPRDAMALAGSVGFPTPGKCRTHRLAVWQVYEAVDFVYTLPWEQPLGRGASGGPLLTPGRHGRWHLAGIEAWTLTDGQGQKAHGFSLIDYRWLEKVGAGRDVRARD